MPVVPTLDVPSVQAEPLPGRASPRIDTDVSPQDFGSGLAQGLEAVGTEGAQIQADLKRQNDQLRVVDANSQLEAAKNAMLYGKAQPDGTRSGGAYSLKGGDAINMPDRILPQFDAVAQGINSTLTPDQQRLFQAHIALGRNEMNLGLNRYEYEQSNAMASHVYDFAGQQSINNAALNWKDPQQLAKAKADLYSLVSLEGHREGWAPEQQVFELQALQAKLYQGVVNQMIQDGDPYSARSYVAGIPRGDIPPALQEKLTQQVKVAQADDLAGTIMQAYRQDGQQAGTRAFALIDNMGLPDDVADQVRSNVQKGLGLWRDEQRQKYGDQLEQVEQHIASGSADMGDRSAIWTMYRAGVLGPSEAGGAIGRIEKAEQDKLRADAWREQIDGAYRNGQPLDPKDDDVKNGVADLFTQYTKGVTAGSTEWINRAADIASKTGVTPAPVIAWTRTQLASGDPDTAAKAAAALQRQQDVNPLGLSYAIDDKTKAISKLINDSVTAGADPAAAVTNARAILNMPDAQKEALEQSWRELHKDGGAPPATPLKAKLSGLPGFDAGWFSKNPDIPPQMVSQFQELQHDYYKLTNGNLDQASSLAFNDLKNTWGITQVNGTRELMQFAPEAMHPGIDTDALRADMQSSAAGHTPDPSKVRLQVYDGTYSSNGQRFVLAAPDQFGAYDIIRDLRGNPMPYEVPDFTQDVKAARDKAIAMGMDKLKAKQAAAQASEQAMMDSIDQAQQLRQRFRQVDAR